MCIQSIFKHFQKDDISVKSGQLLCVVALNAENSIIQHLNQLLTAMIKCCFQPNHIASTHVRTVFMYKILGK